MLSSILIAFSLLIINNVNSQYWNQWDSIAGLDDLNGNVYALLINPNNGDIYVGGDFTYSSGTGVVWYFFAITNNRTTIQTFSSGLNGPVNALCFGTTNDVVYVGGNFNRTNLGETAGVASVNVITQTWSNMYGSHTGIVKALVYSTTRNTLFVGGSFQKSQVSYSMTSWNGVEWTILANGNNPITVVNALLLYPPDFVVAVGNSPFLIHDQQFGNWVTINIAGTVAYSLALNTETSVIYIGGSGYVKKLSNLNSPTVTDIRSGFSNSVYTLNYVTESNYRRQVFNGGSFPSAIYGCSTSNCESSSLSTSWFGPGKIVRAMVVDNQRHELIIGGLFNSAGNVPTTNLAVLNLVPPALDPRSVCIIMPIYQQQTQTTINFIKPFLQTAFSNVTWIAPNDETVVSDYDGCEIALVLTNGDPPILSDPKSWGDMLLQRVKEGMGIVVTETCLRVEMGCWPGSNIVSEALCNEAVSYGSGTPDSIFNILDPTSPVFEGTEYFQPMYIAAVRYQNRSDSELLAVQSSSSWLAACVRHVPNLLGSTTNTVVLNLHPYSQYYRVGIFEPLIISALKYSGVPPTPLPPAHQCLQYVGCYADNSTSPDLKFRLGSNLLTSVEYGVSKCNNFQFFGLQDGNQLYCGDSFGKYGPGNSCNESCASNSNENCGGNSQNSVWGFCDSNDYGFPIGTWWATTNENMNGKAILKFSRWNSTDILLQISLDLEENNIQFSTRQNSIWSAPIVLGATSNSLNITAHEAGFLIQISTETSLFYPHQIPISQLGCVFSNSNWFNVSSNIISESTTCTSPFTPMPTPQPTPHFNSICAQSLGCWKDENERALNETREDFELNTTVELAAEFCFGEFHLPYLGIQIGHQVMCGYNYSLYGPATHCNYTCLGNSGEQCGGDLANNVWGVCNFSNSNAHKFLSSWSLVSGPNFWDLGTCNWHSNGSSDILIQVRPDFANRAVTLNTFRNNTWDFDPITVQIPKLIPYHLNVSLYSDGFLVRTSPSFSVFYPHRLLLNENSMVCVVCDNGWFNQGTNQNDAQFGTNMTCFANGSPPEASQMNNLDENTNNGWKIGLGIGLAFFVLICFILVLVAFYFYRRKFPFKRKQNYQFKNQTNLGMDSSDYSLPEKLLNAKDLVAPAVVDLESSKRNSTISEFSDQFEENSQTYMLPTVQIAEKTEKPEKPEKPVPTILIPIPEVKVKLETIPESIPEPENNVVPAAGTVTSKNNILFS